MSRWARRLIGTAVIVAAALLTALGLATFASAAGSGQVYVVQAVAGTTVQILVDGSVVQPAAESRSVIGPLSLSVGQHVILVKSASATLVTARFSVAANDSLDVVAHRASDTAMSPVVTVFRNDLSAVGPGKTRLVVSHVAVAEPADIRVDGKPFFRNVANGESLSLVVPAKTYSLDVVATTTGRTILAPVRVTLRAGTLTRIFSFGNPDQHTSDAVVQVLAVPVVGAAQPNGVHTGDGGQAADEFVGDTPLPWPAIATGLGLLTLAGIAGAARGAVRSVQVTGGRPGR
jgi:hypothetical protein